MLIDTENRSVIARGDKMVQEIVQGSKATNSQL